MVAHIQRHRNELVYLKCLSENCDYCTTYPPKATGVFAFLQERNMTLFSPMPSHKYPGHYCTFLEMCRKPASELTTLDAGMPSAANGVGRCSHCPAFVFLSKTEKSVIFDYFIRSRVKLERTQERQGSHFSVILSWIQGTFAAKALTLYRPMTTIVVIT